MSWWFLISKCWLICSCLFLNCFNFWLNMCWNLVCKLVFRLINFCCCWVMVLFKSFKFVVIFCSKFCFFNWFVNLAIVVSRGFSLSCCCFKFVNWELICLFWVVKFVINLFIFCFCCLRLVNVKFNWFLIFDCYWVICFLFVLKLGR